jgi:transcriptional regulator with XRE-family HTH domain
MDNACGYCCIGLGAGADLAGESNLKAEFAARIRLARDALNFNQSKMASAGGVTLRAYQAYERAEAWPSFEVGLGWSKLGISIDWLLTGAGDMFISNRVGAGAIGATPDQAHQYPGFCAILHDGDRHATRLDLVPEVMANALAQALPFIDRARITDEEVLWRAAASTLIGSYNLSFWEWFRSREKGDLISASGKTKGGNEDA